MKKTFIYLFIMGVAALLPACKDFLEEESETNFTSNSLFETQEGLEKMLIALYDYERGIVKKGDANGLLAAFLYGERGTDLQLFTTGSDANISRFTSPGPTSNINDLLYSPYWKHRYYIIGRTNEIISYGNKLGEGTEAIVAEASFWRAYSYYGLFSRFSRLFLTTEPVTKETLDSFTYAPADSADVFNLMYSDLDKAIAGLPYQPENEMTGRVTKATAMHLKALVAAWGQDWAEVAKQVDAFETDGEITAALVGDPRNIFNTSDLYNSETLWAIKFSNERGGGTGHRVGAQFVNIMAEQKYSQRIVNGELIKYHTGNLGRQWGLAFPNSYLISLYPANDLRRTAYYKLSYTYENPTALITVPAATDITVDGKTIKSTSNMTGAPYQTKIGDAIVGRDVFAASATKIDRRAIVPSSLKMVDLWSKMIDADDPSASFKDLLVFRLAETYLLGAEAYMHLGNQEKARGYYNRTWMRAGNPEEMNEITFDMIRDENARELAFEGRRWDFLKRTGIWYSQVRSYAGDFTKKPGTTVPYNAAAYGISDGRDLVFGPDPNYYYDFNGSDNDVLVRFNVQPFHKNWPIPQDQIDAMGVQNFPQNAGY